jgi:hypothetical protein
LKLFLDDERFPPNDGAFWIIVRDVGEAVTLMEQTGCPGFLSFDHDLGKNVPTGYDLAHWMVERDMDQDGKFIPANFEYYVHSQNPPGAANIKALLDNYLKQR